MSGPSRREFFRASTATVAMTTPVATAICPQDHLAADNMPFIVRLADEPDIAAVCVPAGRITHAYCYMLSDGRTIFAEQDRCNDGTGWRDCLSMASEKSTDRAKSPAAVYSFKLICLPSEPARRACIAV